jgi:hypothetical protein
MTMGTKTVATPAFRLEIDRHPGPVTRMVESLRARAAWAREETQDLGGSEAELPRLDRPLDTHQLLMNDRYRFNRLS